MPYLSDKDREKIIKTLAEGRELPTSYQTKLFASDEVDYVEATKDYKLVYKGKTPQAKVIADTPAAPLQEIREFNTDNPHSGNWANMLIFGDNLYALKAIYDDQRKGNKLGTKNKIKLIYIDPPFATKQDFMKDREKAYRDKIIGAEFIEFLRKRLILMREILADDGSIFVHLDWKKGHYIKAIMDEVFGEHNFVNEIIWQCTDPKNNVLTTLGSIHQVIYFYAKDKQNRTFNILREEHSASARNEYSHFLKPTELIIDGDVVDTGKMQHNGRYFKLENTTAPKKTVSRIVEWKKYTPTNGWRYSTQDLNAMLASGRILLKAGRASSRCQVKYLDEQTGIPLQTIWQNVGTMKGGVGTYPTEKPEELLSKVISLALNKEQDNIVLDCFMGSGTALAVAEKLNYRWIGIDCGKLAIYSTQKRILNLTTQIGSMQGDKQRDYERVETFEDHSKTSRGLFMVYEKARAGDLIIDDDFLKGFGSFIDKYLSGHKEELISLICPEDKFQVSELEVSDLDDEGDRSEKAGQKLVKVGRVKFLISFIAPKEEPVENKPLKAKHFKLLYSGIYDNEAILKMKWEQYKPFVAQLFDVRLAPHKIKAFEADGYIGTNSTYIWNYPGHSKLEIDEGYVEDLHKALGGKGGDKFYVVAPIVSMRFMQDEIKRGDTTYVFLKVPLSVIMALIQKKQPGALRQPVTEADVNEVIDAVGYDFISQPVVKAKYRQTKTEYVIDINEFRSNTLAYDPEEFSNFETLSMVMIDVDYNEKTQVFDLDKVFWSDKILNSGKTKAEIRIPSAEFTGKSMMILYMDKYGNEYKVVKRKNQFE